MDQNTDSGERRAPSVRQWRLGDWQPVGEGCWRLVAEPATVNLGLVVGTQGAVLIDTGSSPRQGAELRDRVAEITELPLLAVVVTHAHYDHAFGLAAFDDLPTIGHESLAATLASTEAAEGARELGLDPVELTAPNTPIGLADAVDLGGGRVVEVVHLGIGHTQGDLVVTLPQPKGPSVIFAGDLIESAGPPWFGPDSSADQWSWTCDRLANLAGPDTLLVPGHGDPVDRDFVLAQRNDIDGVRMELERLAAEGVGEQDALEQGDWPFPAENVAGGIAPGYAEIRAAGRQQPGADGRPTLPLA